MSHSAPRHHGTQKHTLASPVKPMWLLMRTSNISQVVTLMVISSLLVPVPYIYVLAFAPPVKDGALGPGNHMYHYLTVSFLGGALRGINQPITKTLLVTATPTKMRGYASGIITMMDEVGRGAGSYIVSWLVIYFDGRKQAFAISFIIWTGAAVCYLFMLLCTSSESRLIRALMNT